jgi:hypothetical protein
VHEAVFENCLADGGNAFRHGIDRHELRLHVGREGRVWRRPQTHRFQARRRHQADGVALDGDLATGIHQLVDDRIEIGRGSPHQADIAAGGGGGAQVGAGLDAVGHDRVRGAM